MYVRVWYDDGSISDRPCTTVWDGHPAAEWPPEPNRRVLVASQAFHDNGTPALPRSERQFTVPSGCAHIGVVYEATIDDLPQPGA